MDWKKCLNNREEINSVEVNPSKLIDSICHRLLLAKLKAYCFSSSALRLVSVFFVDRLQIVANLSTRRSWYHGRQPEVFLQHDSHRACQDVLELRSRTSKREFWGWNQRFRKFTNVSINKAKFVNIWCPIYRNTSWKVLAYGIYARVVDVSEIERVSATNE